MLIRSRACRALGALLVTVAVSAQVEPYRTGSIDEILAPIALYPDQLLAQMLISSQSPKDVTRLDQWLKLNSSIGGTQLQDEAVKAGFEASFVALTLFPQVVVTMAQQITWTTRLGEVFTADRSAVFNSIQKLRAQAKAMGTLKSTAQQEVETKTTESGQQVIVIEPANPQVVYVPQYNTQVVYTQPATSTVVIHEDDDSGAAVAAGMIGFTAGIAIGAAFDNNYYYGPYGWRGGGYMYNDAWDDYYDARDDARDDWQDHREDLSENRTDRSKSAQEQRTDRTEARSERGTTATQAQTQRSTEGRATATQTDRTGTTRDRGYGDSAAPSSATGQRAKSSDAFSGYSSGSSQRSSSSRGNSSRSSSRSRSGSGGRRR
jgi:hypothetical protein